ncbi:hypothetical protein SBRCBS47491_000868 [Sporothrix bragantina]|uniref:Uncharacterized protein n=1 Tax=Sporothrix bragantina TaxID=671064 RepID=A0ABP0ATX2_9PEZI
MALVKVALLLAAVVTPAVAKALPDFSSAKGCPPCFTSTVYTPGVCGKPRCTSPAVPCASFATDTAVTTTTTVTKVVNTNVCSVLPILTKAYPCPPAPACEAADVPCTTTTNTFTVTTTSDLLECYATITPWIQPLPPGYTPTPPLPPSYAWPSALPPAVTDS